MQRGTTLLELTLSLAIIGLLLGIALPQLRGLTDSIAVDRAAHEIIAAHRRARMVAVLRSQVIELTVDSADLAIRARGSAVDLWHAPGPAASRVALAGPQRRITFSPVGMSMGLSNASFRLSRGASVRTVVVSRLGRVRIVP
jgi:prepilin-type N-terminal cleavage/methylation domain-containing protein